LAGERPTFGTYGLHEILVENLRGAGITHPTEIQRMSLPDLISGTSITFSAETGSGKTLCEATLNSLPKFPPIGSHALNHLLSLGMN